MRFNICEKFFFTAVDYLANQKEEDYLERKVRPVELLTGLRCNEGHLCSDKLMHARYITFC